MSQYVVIPFEYNTEKKYKPTEDFNDSENYVCFRMTLLPKDLQTKNTFEFFYMTCFFKILWKDIKGDNRFKPLVKDQSVAFFTFEEPNIVNTIAIVNFSNTKINNNELVQIKIADKNNKDIIVKLMLEAKV